MSKVIVMDHPLIQHKIGWIRRADTGSKDFRTLISEIAMLMCYEATRDLELTDVAAAGGEDFFFPVADSLAGAGKDVIDVVSGFLLVESDRCARMEFRRDDAVFAVIEHPDSHCSFPAIHSGEDSFFYFIEIDQHGWLLFILLPRQQGNGFDVPGDTIMNVECLREYIQNPRVCENISI